jgi:flagellar basal-body rod protein FlgF
MSVGGEESMENTLLIGLSRQMSLSRELDVVANNIANLNTTGFKSDTSTFQEYLMPVARDGQFPRKDSRLSYVVDRATWQDFGQGAVEQTGNPLDLAIDGDAFLTVQTAAGERYTRNGSLQINATGQLVTMNGDPVLGAAGPIVFQPGDREINIAADGSVTVREGTSTADAVRGKLQLASFPDRQQLQKDGAAMFAAPAGVTPVAPTKVKVVQGAVEKSNVRSVLEMTRMIEVTRNYTDVSALLQQQGDLHKSAIERLADVPA